MTWTHFWTDMLCGTISGLGNCLSGYIFDTLKVRMQMDPSLHMLQSLKSIIRNEGFMHLFNGIYYPLLTVPLINAVVFSSYELFKKITKKEELSLYNGIENGAFAGLVNSIVVSPVELIKCRMQLDKDNKFLSSHHCAKEIIRTEGLRGLFQGFYSTAFREIFAYAAQFATYEYLKDKIVGKSHPTLSFTQGLLVGTVAGINCWIFSYPQDIIKTMLQVSEPGKYKPIPGLFDGGFYSCGAEIYRTRGLKGFLVGIQPCLVRASIANAIGIGLYEQAQYHFTHSHTIQNY